MKDLRVLVAMQLKNRLNLSFSSVKETIFKVVYALLKFILTVVLCYFVLWFVATKNLVSMMSVIPTSVMSLLMLIILSLSTIFTTIEITKDLYFSFDNRILLTLPTSPTIVFSSKLITAYIFEIVRNFGFLIPLFFGYGILTGFKIHYYLWVIVASCLISIIPILLGSVLSLVMMVVFNFFRKYKTVKIISFILVIALFTFAIFEALLALPDDINLIGNWPVIFTQIQDFLNQFVVDFSFIYKLTSFTIGSRIGLTHIMFSINTLFTFLMLVAFIVLTTTITLTINRPLFYKMASKPFEFRKDETIRNRKNHLCNGMLSIIVKDCRLNFRSSSKMFNSLYLLIGLPFAILLLNKIFTAMDTSMLGNSLCLVFTILMSLLISLTTNSQIASIYSREGKAGYLIKTMPEEPWKFLMGKLMFTFIIGTIAHVALYVVLRLTLSINLEYTIYISLALYLIYLGHFLWSAELDIMKPQNEKYLTEGENVKNSNENTSTIFAFVIAFLFAVIALLLFMESIGKTYFKLLLIASIFFVYRLYQYIIKAKYLYKERTE